MGALALRASTAALPSTSDKELAPRAVLIVDDEPAVCLLLSEMLRPTGHPILTAGTNSLGMAMAWRMMADGKTGVATNASYDQWSPARQYSLNHRGIRILTETASARLASPLDRPFSSLGTARGYDARVASWNFPAPWPGGTWTLGNIVDYQTSASWALLVEAARRLD